MLWLAACALISVLQGGHFYNRHSGRGLLDSYWVDYYLLNYQDGFHRRALIGSILRLVYPQGASLLAINAFAALLLSLLLFVFVTSVYLFLRERPSFTKNALIPASALLVSAVGSVFSETSGDLLQLCFVLVASFLWFARSQPLMAKLPLALCVLLLCLQIHEASIFLFFPCVLLETMGRRSRPRILLLVAFAVAAALLVALLKSNTGGHLTYTARLLGGHGVFEPRPDITQSFTEAMRQEREQYFSSLPNFLGYLFRIQGTFAPLVAAIVGLAGIMTAARFRLFMGNFLLLFGFSLPLYAVAHDWGRFEALTLLLCLLWTIILHVPTIAAASPGISGGVADRLAEICEAASRNEYGMAAAALLLVLSPQLAFRDHGMITRLYAAFVPLILLAIIAVVQDQRDQRSSCALI
jgi:hypothetical protein